MLLIWVRWGPLHLRLRGSLGVVEGLVRLVRCVCICRLRTWTLRILWMPGWHKIGACPAKMLLRVLLRMLHAML
jgi:hypothetical protein